MIHEDITLGPVRLIRGDCTLIAPTLEGVDAVITDPPYGLSFQGLDWDKEVPEIATRLPSMFKSVAIIMAPTIIWSFPKPTWVACWARPASSSRSCVGGFNHWSPVLLYGDRNFPVDFKSWHAIAHSYKVGELASDHPSPKPESLMAWLVERMADANQLILDPFMGSGTTLIAAIRTGRRAIGIEIDERHFRTAVERVKRELAQPMLPAMAPQKVEQQDLLA